MGEQVHIIPVGFDYTRLIQIFSTEEELSPDKIYLISTTDDEDTRAGKLASQMVDKLDQGFTTVLSADVEQREIEDLYDYVDVYKAGYDLISTELEDGNQVYINISSMPRTVAFAFATAADTLVIEQPDRRDTVHTYYTAPKRYRVLGLLDQVEAHLEFLSNRLEEEDDEALQDHQERLEEEYQSIMDEGVTQGVRNINEAAYIEFPTPPMTDLDSIQEELLHVLASTDSISSISDLAKEHAKFFGHRPSQSHRSKVQYHVDQLKENRYIELTEAGNSKVPTISTMGKLWVRTHNVEK